MEHDRKRRTQLLLQTRIQLGRTIRAFLQSFMLVLPFAEHTRIKTAIYTLSEVMGEVKRYGRGSMESIQAGLFRSRTRREVLLGE